MKCTVVNSSELTRFGRWDATFFVALHDVYDPSDVVATVKKRHEELLKQYPGEAGAAAVRAILSNFTLDERRVCLPLIRDCNNWCHNSLRKNIEAVENEYPHLALALVEPTIAEALKNATWELACAEDRWRTLNRLKEN